jgi:hypothetical protein
MVISRFLDYLSVRMLCKKVRYRGWLVGHRCRVPDPWRSEWPLIRYQLHHF